MMIWYAMHPQATPEMLGIIPEFLDEADPRPAREQFQSNYVGGWEPLDGFKLIDGDRLLYATDPPLNPLIRANFRDEEITFYEYEWVMVRQKDGSWEVARMD